MHIIDFDGTIVDLWRRYHSVFCSLVDCDITIAEYIDIKQRLKKDGKIAEALNKKLPDDYFAQKAIRLEEIDYLQKDTLLLPREEILRFFNQNNAIVLTKRRNAQNFFGELKELGLADIVDKAMCISSSKLEWVKANINEDTIIIGDDVRDLQVASLDNVKATMVLSGLGTVADFDLQNIDYQIVPRLRDYIYSL